MSQRKMSQNNSASERNQDLGQLNDRDQNNKAQNNNDETSSTDGCSIDLNSWFFDSIADEPSSDCSQQSSEQTSQKRKYHKAKNTGRLPSPALNMSLTSALGQAEETKLSDVVDTEMYGGYKTDPEESSISPDLQTSSTTLQGTTRLVPNLPTTPSKSSYAQPTLDWALNLPCTSEVPPTSDASVLKDIQFLHQPTTRTLTPADVERLDGLKNEARAEIAGLEEQLKALKVELEGQLYIQDINVSRIRQWERETRVCQGGVGKYINKV